MTHHDLLQIINSLSSGLLVYDEEKVLIWNRTAERITGVPSSELRGHSLNRLPAAIRDLLRIQGDEVLFTRPSGALLSLEVNHELVTLDGPRQVTAVIFHDITEQVQSHQELQQFAMEMTDTKDLMEEQAANLALVLAEVDEKKEIIERQNRKIFHELEMAAKLQQSLLPNMYRSFNGVSFASRYIPSIHIGGDLYDVVDLGQGLTGFIIADVSGHGVAAALVAAMFKMSFHTLAADVASPKVLFHLLNEQFTDILNEDYVTAFYLIHDRSSGTIRYCNAGHPTPFLLRARDNRILPLDTDGFFIGMFDDGDYEEKTITIEDGDSILLYTDCLLETEDEEGTPFGKERLMDLFTATVLNNSGEDAILNIESQVRAFDGDDNFNDDFTALLLEFDRSAALELAAPAEPDHGGEFEEF